MSDPSQESRAHQNAALSFVNDCLRYFGGLDQRVRVRQTNRRPWFILYGPIMQTIRFVKAAAVLTGDRHSLEAHVLARSALEYAVTVQYAYLRADGLDRLEKSSAAHQRELFERLAKWQHDATYKDLAKRVATPIGAKSMPPIMQILDVLDPEHIVLQSTYAVLSQISHVRAGSQHRFFELVDGQVVLVPGRDDDRFAHVSTGALAIATMGVTWVYARLTEDAEMIAMLEAASGRLGIPIRYDEDWSADERAHPD